MTNLCIHVMESPGQTCRWKVVLILKQSFASWPCISVLQFCAALFTNAWWLDFRTSPSDRQRPAIVILAQRPLPGKAASRTRSSRTLLVRSGLSYNNSAEARRSNRLRVLSSQLRSAVPFRVTLLSQPCPSHCAAIDPQKSLRVGFRSEQYVLHRN